MTDFTLADLTIESDPNEGQWVTAMETEHGPIRFHCIGTRSKAFRKAENKMSTMMTNRERNLIRQGDMGALERFEQARLKMKAEICILGWQGLPDTEGNPLSFDKATCVKLMTHPKYRPVRDMMERAIDMVDEGLAETQEDAEKNSPSISSGNIAPMSSADSV